MKLQRLGSLGPNSRHCSTTGWGHDKSCLWMRVKSSLIFGANNRFGHEVQAPDKTGDARTRRFQAHLPDTEQNLSEEIL